MTFANCVNFVFVCFFPFFVLQICSKLITTVKERTQDSEGWVCAFFLKLVLCNTYFYCISAQILWISNTIHNVNICKYEHWNSITQRSGNCLTQDQHRMVDLGLVYHIFLFIAFGQKSILS